MQLSSIPLRFQLAWAANAAGAYIRTVPVASQIGVQAGAASYNDGFVPDNFTQIAAGGVPPFGQDMNGVLNETTTWDQWYQAGGPIPYDATFSTAQNGYPKGAVIPSAVVLGTTWVSLVDNNTTNPDAGGANWAQNPAQIQTGTPVQSLSSVVPYGYVAANALTIGNAASNGTARANADTVFLFNFCWALPASVCPVFTSTGSPTTRGVNPAADFAANIQIATPNMKGLGLIGADTMGGSSSSFLAGVPVTSGNATIPGSIIGENLHSLVAGENATHTHGITDPSHTHTSNAQLDTGGNSDGGGGPGPLTSASPAAISSAVTGITINNQGSGTGHNTVERNIVVYWNLKL